MMRKLIFRRSKKFASPVESEEDFYKPRVGRITTTLLQNISELLGHRSMTLKIDNRVVVYRTIYELVQQDDIAFRVWCRLRDDVFNKGFTIRSDDETFVEYTWVKLKQLKLKEALKIAWAWTILYGYSPILKIYDNENLNRKTLKNDPKPGSKLMALVPINPRNVDKVILDDDINSDTFGEVKSIRVKLGKGRVKEIAASRLLWMAHPDPDGHPLGLPIFYPVVETFVYKKHADRALATTLVKNARKVPILMLSPETDDDTFEEIKDEWAEMTYSDQYVARGAVDIKEIGGAGNLNPDPFVNYFMKNLATGLGFPVGVLLDPGMATKGSATESMKTYYSMISNYQTEIIEPLVVSVIDELIEREQLPPAQYQIIWNPLEESTFAEKAQATMRANLGLLNLAKALEVLTQSVGIPFEPDKYELLPTEYNSFELVKKPEADPERLYHITLSINMNTETYRFPLTKNEVKSLLVNNIKIPDRVRNVINPKALKTYYSLVANTILKEYNDEVGINQSDLENIMRDYADIINNFVTYFEKAIELHDAGFKEIQIVGKCKVCEANGIYGRYRIDGDNLTKLPLIPLHDKKRCKPIIQPV